eukprot:TRINITY_DN38658_c0_g1_i1.p1 TRINITY_DN38658_c0_g1~~TRINITY_DN38658_c0_g1_i1.p1  ORF type:complete len:1283 (+),score=297.65 TRINITY_DN38658_c0_g1_i1:317-3850(+)
MYDASTLHAEMSEAARAEKLHGYASRLVSSDAFTSTAFTGVFLAHDALQRDVAGTPFPRYLEKEKGVLPFMTFPWGFTEEADNVQLSYIENEEQIYQEAIKAGIVGMRSVSVIKRFSSQGMRSLVQQQFEIATKSWAKGLLPVISIIVDIYAPDREKIEALLLRLLIEFLGGCGRESIMFVLPVPKLANVFLPLIRHPRCLRVMGSTTSPSGPGFNLAVSSRLVAQNLNMSTCFGRAVVEGLRTDQSDAEFAAALQVAVDSMLEASTPATAVQEQSEKVAHQAGFLVYLEQTPTGLSQFHIDQSAADDVIADSWNRAIARMLETPSFTGASLLGVMINRHAMENLVIRNIPVMKYLWEQKNVAPILTTECIGLKEEAKGVQLLKSVADIVKMLDLAVEHKVFGVCAKSVIVKPVELGVRGVCRQQFDLAKQIMARGLVPIMKISVTAPVGAVKAACEKLLFNELMVQLGKLKHNENVILDLRVPDEDNIYFPLMGHPNVLRVVAHSAGLPREVSCNMIARNFHLVASLGNAFIEGLSPDLSDEAFDTVLRESCEAIYKASTEVAVKEVQEMKVQTSDGIFLPLDQGIEASKKTLALYAGIVPESKDEQLKEIWKMRLRMLKDPVINGSIVTMISISEEMIDAEVNDVLLPKYLWEEKQVVPCVAIDKGLAAEKDGVRMMKVLPQLEAILDKAAAASVFGARMKASIKAPNESGIKHLVHEQLAVSEKIRAKGLLPILSLEVEKGATQKGKCEDLLVSALLDAMSALRPSDKMVVWLTPPCQPNVYLPLISHPNIIRTVMSSGELESANACEVLGKNVGMIAGFGSACIQDLRQSMADGEYSSTLEASCKAMFAYSRAPEAKDYQMAKIADQRGFFLLLDQRNSVAPLLKAFGSAVDESAGPDKLLDKLHEQNTHLMANPMFNGSCIIGAALDADTIARRIKSSLAGRFLWEEQRIAPFMNIDYGFDAERQGVQLLIGTENITADVDKAIAFGCIGVKVRAVIKRPDVEGILSLVMQQFDLAQQVIAKGLVPILHLYVDSDDKQEACEKILRQQLMSRMRTLDDEKARIIFALRMPVKPDTYAALAAHEKTLRVLAIAPHMSCDEAASALSKLKGTTPAYGCALVMEGLSETQADKEFTATLANTLSVLSRASSSRGQQSAKSIDSKAGAKSKPAKTA